MVVLSAGYWIFTIIGIISTFVTTVLCVYILKKYTIEFKTWKKLEYKLILLRVVFDALNSFTIGIYYITSIFTLLHSEIVSFEVSFLIALTGTNFLEMRSFLAAIIAIERVCATIFPINFHNYRKRISNIPIIAFIISTGISVDVVLFGFCGLKFPLDPSCSCFNCVIPLCYRNYFTASKIVYASTNATFSGILCCKLFWLSLKQTIEPTDLRKANLISLTDGLSTVSFDLIPSLIFSSGLIDLKSLGPAMGVFRQIGRAVEASVMVKLMKKTTVIMITEL